MRIPQSLSVIGCDDSPAAPYMTPPLTTIRQPYRRIGAVAVEHLLAQIAGEAVKPKQIRIPGDLIVRDSVAPPWD